MPRKESTTGPISAQAQQDLVSEGIENFELPKSIITKIAKSAIPDNAKLQKETVLCLVKGSTVFINYLAATAHDVALSKQHKSISASDVLKALEICEFGDLVDMLQGELQAYRDIAKSDKTKKVSSGSASVGKGKGKEVVESLSSASAFSSKGKGNPVTGALPPPFTTTPRVSAAGTSPVAPDYEMEVEVEVEVEVEDEEEEMEDEVVEDEGEAVMGPEAEVEDRIAIEEEEMRRDAMGLENTVSETQMDV